MVLRVIVWSESHDNKSGGFRDLRVPFGSQFCSSLPRSIWSSPNQEQSMGQLYSPKLTWHLPGGRNPKGNSSSNPNVSGVMLVSGRVCLWLLRPFVNFVVLSATWQRCWYADKPHIVGQHDSGLDITVMVVSENSGHTLWNYNILCVYIYMWYRKYKYTNTCANKAYII